MALPITQFTAAPGTIDLAWGHPDPDLLSADLLSRASERALRRHGADALAYGASQGAGPLIEALGEHLAEIDGRAPSLDEILVTAGASAGLDQVATLLCQPGDVVLVESPTYHLAVRILRDHPVELFPVTRGSTGIEADAVARAVREVRSRGRIPRLLYSVTTFANPTSGTLPQADRVRLAQVARNEDLIIVEDDTYRELWYDAPPPPSVWAVAGGANVIRLGSFSKTLAPGLRLGYLTAPAETVSLFAQGGLLDSGGGNAHMTALIVAELIERGHYRRLVDDLRSSYRERRDALVEELRNLGLAFDLPAGGYFTWVDIGQRANGTLLDQARRAGTNYVPGDVFFVQPATSSHIRVSFSRYSADQLREGARRLGQALERSGRRPDLVDPTTSIEGSDEIPV